MATVYCQGTGEQENVAPTTGAKYWWYKSDRVLLVLTILETSYDPNAHGAAEDYEVKLRWDHYMGLVNTDKPVYSGETTWNRKEWEAANFQQYVKPLDREDLAPDEELCKSCCGCYFEVGRDLEIMGCIWCDKNKPGTRKKSPPAPQPSQRSPFHPAVL